jgi:hypothetical protein
MVLVFISLSSKDFKKKSMLFVGSIPSIRNGRFQFHKRRQLFIRVHNETLPIIAMRVCNPDCSPFGINRCEAAPTPTGFTEILGRQSP